MLWYRKALGLFAALCALLLGVVWVQWPSSGQALALIVLVWVALGLVSAVLELIFLPKGAQANRFAIYASWTLRVLVAALAAWILWDFLSKVLNGHVS